jgi:hypothetical protein
MFYLPSYLPELNPDENLNCNLNAGVHSGIPVSKKGRSEEIDSFPHENVAKAARRGNELF